MEEMRRMCRLLDVNDIRTRHFYIRSAANILADILSREMDYDVWKLNTRVFHYLDTMLWRPHPIDRIASMENAQFPRFNARLRDLKC
jgi:hypothetical protein